MLDVIDLSKYVIAYADEVLKRPIDNLQLQKILYYIKGIVLARFDYECFNEDILAIGSGPYLYGPYKAFHYMGVYKIHIHNKIKYDKNNYDIWHCLDSEPSYICDVIHDIIKEKSKYSSWELSLMSIREIPWQNTKSDQVISNELLKKGFKNGNGSLYAK